MVIVCLYNNRNPNSNRLNPLVLFLVVTRNRFLHRALVYLSCPNTIVYTRIDFSQFRRLDAGDDIAIQAAI